MTFIIAEIGINHNGDLNNAKKLIDLASVAGCNAVKFQNFTAEKLATKNKKKTAVQFLNGNKISFDNLNLNSNKISRSLKVACLILSI